MKSVFYYLPQAGGCGMGKYRYTRHSSSRPSTLYLLVRARKYSQRNSGTIPDRTQFFPRVPILQKQCSITCNSRGKWSSYVYGIRCRWILLFLLPSDNVQHDSSTWITPNFPERRKPRKQKETHIVQCFYECYNSVVVSGKGIVHSY